MPHTSAKSITRIGRAAGVLLALALATCADDATEAADAAADSVSDSAQPHDAAADTVGSQAGDTMTAQDTGHPVDTTAVADTAPTVDTSGGRTPLGVGVLLSELDSSFLDLAFVAARLTRVPVPPDTSGTVHGPCRVTEIHPDAPQTERYGLDAGEITVTGTTPALTFTPSSEGALGTGYDSGLADDHEDLLPGWGAIISIAGAGGADVAAFSGVVQAPEPVTLSRPQTGIGVSHDPAQTLAVNWNAGTGEEVVVSLTPIDQFGSPLAGAAAFCVTDGDPGSVLVPSAALLAIIGNQSSIQVALGVTRTRTGRGQNADHIVPFTVTRSTGGPLTLAP